jgi:hypothetical protein
MADAVGQWEDVSNPSAGAGAGAGKWEDVPNPTPPKSFSDHLGDFAGHTWDALTGAVTGPVKAVLHPIDTVSAILRDAADEIGKGKEAYEKGDYDRAAEHFKYALPVAGPLLRQMRQETDAGDYGAALGDITGFVAGGKMLHAAPAVLKRTAKAVVAAPSAAMDAAGAFVESPIGQAAAAALPKVPILPSVAAPFKAGFNAYRDAVGKQTVESVPIVNAAPAAASVASPPALARAAAPTTTQAKTITADAGAALPEPPPEAAPPSSPAPTPPPPAAPSTPAAAAPDTAPAAFTDTETTGLQIPRVANARAAIVNNMADYFHKGGLKAADLEARRSQPAAWDLLWKNAAKVSGSKQGAAYAPSADTISATIDRLETLEKAKAVADDTRSALEDQLIESLTKVRGKREGKATVGDLMGTR